MAFLLEWDKVGERVFETGTDRAVLYLQDNDGSYPEGVAWNGLTTVNQTPSGAELTPLYADNIKYLNLQSAEEFGATIECYTYPEEFETCNGDKSIAKGVTIGQQARRNFGFSYRSLVGNDIQNTSYGYKIHLIYGCTATPTETSHQTVNDSPDAATFSFEISTTPIPVPGDGNKPTSHITIDTTKCEAAAITALEKILYGDPEDSDSKPRLPLPEELLDIINNEKPEGSADEEY